MTLGQYLHATRTRSGKPMREIVRGLSISRQTVYSWERPGCRPEPVDIRRYLAFLGASESEILEALRLRSLPRDEAA